MSLQDDLTAVKRCLEDLVRTVGQLERSIAEERGTQPLSPPSPPSSPPSTPPSGSRPEPLVTIPDAPYNSALWTDTDDEGLGARDRHAP